MTDASPFPGFDLAPWLASNAALAAQISDRLQRRGRLGSMLSGLASRGITGVLDEERTRRLKSIAARGSKGNSPGSGAGLASFGGGNVSALTRSTFAPIAGSRVGWGESSLSTAALLARGYQPAVVKVISYAHGVTRATASAQYVERDDVQLETHDGKTLADKEAVAQEIEAWSSRFEKRSPSQDVVSVRVQLSGLVDRPEDRTLLSQAVSAAFDGHRHAMRIDVQKDGVLEARVVAVMARAIPREERAHQGDRVRVPSDVADRPALPPRLRVTEQRMGAGDDAPMRKVFDARSEAGMKAGITEATGYPIHGICLEPGLPGHGREAVGQRLGTLLSKAPAFDHLGKPLRTVDDLRDVTREWARHLRSQTPRDTMHMVVSAKAGTDVTAFTHAVRAFLHTQFVDHKFMFGVHTDKLEAGHIHAHAIVAVRGENGAKLHPGPADLAHWRINYATQAREHGLEVVATRAAEQASSRSYGSKDKSIVDAATTPRPERKEQDRAYSSDPRNASLIKGAMKRMETARANPVRVPQTERERAGVRESFEHWQAEAKADPANALARNMVERLGAAHAAGRVLDDLRLAAKGAARGDAEVDRAVGSPAVPSATPSRTPLKSADQLAEDLQLLNKQVNEASALLPASSRAGFLKQTELHLDQLAERVDERRSQEADEHSAPSGNGGVTAEATPSFVEATRTENDDPNGSRKLRDQIPSDAAQAGASTSASEQEERPHVHQDQSERPSDTVAKIRRQQAELLEGVKAQRQVEQDKDRGHEAGE